MTIALRESVLKIYDLLHLKGDTCTKKVRSIRSDLVNFWGCSVLLKITEKTYFITLSQHVNLRFYAQNSHWNEWRAVCISFQHMKVCFPVLISFLKCFVASVKICKVKNSKFPCYLNGKIEMLTGTCFCKAKAKSLELGTFYDQNPGSKVFPQSPKIGPP